MTDACTGKSVFDTDCFLNTSDTAGATTIARLYELENKGQLSGSTTSGIISNIVAYGYTVANVECKEAFVAEQDISVECNNAVIGDLVLNNPSCATCRQLAKKVADSRQQLEQDAKQLNPNYVEQTPSAALQEQYFGVEPNNVDGICRYVCLQCIADDINQNIQMRIVEECPVDTEQFINSWVSGMSLQAEVELTQHQTALRGTGVQIENTDDIKRLSIELSDTIRQMTRVTMLNALNESALAIQETIINSGSTSVVLQNVDQALSLSMFASLVSRSYTNINIQTSIDFKSKQTEIQVETSFADLVTDLETTVRTMDKLILSTIGKIMITLVALLLTIMLIFAAFFFFKPSFLFGGLLSNDGGYEDDLQYNNGFEHG